MEQYSIVNILLKVNNLSGLDGTKVVEEIKNWFTLAIQNEENETERKAIETAYKDWTEGGSKIDHFFQFKCYPFIDSYPSIHKQTLLHFAAKHDYQNVVNALLEAGAKIDVMDGLGYTPLHLAAANGHINIVNALIAKEANVNAQEFYVIEESKDTDFEDKCKKAIEILRKQRITFNTCNYGYSKKDSLHFRSENDYHNAVKILKDEGVDIITSRYYYKLFCL